MSHNKSLYLKINFNLPAVHIGAFRSTIHCKSIEFDADAVMAADFSAEGNTERHLSIN